MRRIAHIAALGLALLSGAALAHDEPRRAESDELTQQPRLSPIRAAPDFALRATDGRTLRLSALRGRPVLVAFIYTGCTRACPLLTWRMSRLHAMLAEAGLAGRATLLSVTVDPERDTAEALGRYAARFGAGPGWHFLTDSAQRLRPILAAYDEWVAPLPDGELDHPARLHLVDARGRVREIYSLAFFDERQAFIDVRALVREAEADRG